MFKVKNKFILGGSSGEMSIRTSEMAELLEEMRRLRRDLERSINKQNELQAKLDENIRLGRTPREFTFSGRGVSYPDLRLTEGTGLISNEMITSKEDQRSRPLGSSTTEIGKIKNRFFHKEKNEKTFFLDVEKSSRKNVLFD